MGRLPFGDDDKTLEPFVPSEAPQENRSVRESLARIPLLIVYQGTDGVLVQPVVDCIRP